MNKVEKRRVNPIAKFATLAVFTLLVFEGLVIGGVFELKARTVAKYAPWAYESFLRLVGEHPESAPRLAEVEEGNGGGESLSGGLDFSGLESSIIPDLIATNDAMLGTNTILESAVPTAVELLHEESATNAIKEIADQVVPVG